MKTLNSRLFYKKGSMMKKPKVTKGSKKLLDLQGKKKYAIQATVRTVTVFNPGERSSSLVDCECLTLHYDFSSLKTPREIAMAEVQAFLGGFETASVRVDTRERLSRNIRVLTINRIENVELLVYTPNNYGKNHGWYWEGQLDVPYKSLFSLFCRLAKKTPNILPTLGNFQRK